MPPGSPGWGWPEFPDPTESKGNGNKYQLFHTKALPGAACDVFNARIQLTSLNKIEENR